MDKGEQFGGLIILGSGLTGLFGLVGAFFSWVNEYDYVGMGLCLIASALAFGMAARAIFKN